MEEEKREEEMKDDDKSKESELNTSEKNLGTVKGVPEKNSGKCQDEKAVKEKKDKQALLPEVWKNFSCKYSIR